MTFSRYASLLFLLFFVGCASSPGSVNLTKRGIVILYPAEGGIVQNGVIQVDVRISEKLKSRGGHLHVHLDGEMYDMLPIAEPIELSGLTDGSHKVEVVLTGHKGHAHMETRFKDSVVFVVDDVGSSRKSRSTTSFSLKEGLGFGSPEEVFAALLSVAVEPDMQLYRRILGREYSEVSLRYGSTKNKDRKVTSITDVHVLKKGTETLSGVHLYYIFSKQVWRFSDGSVSKKELDLHFLKVDGRWIYYPMKGTPFL
ncbi:MAG: hypothetical protein ACE5FU_03805 [Nitrospinota bacterium]